MNYFPWQSPPSFLCFPVARERQTGQVLSSPIRPLLPTLKLESRFREKERGPNCWVLFAGETPGGPLFAAHPQEHELGGKVVKQSMQSAVYKALDGKADQFIVDPHFHVVEHNFFVFKTSKAKVVGRRASNKNYRQVKRFNSDQTETLELERSPQTYTVFRNGKEATKIVTSGNITPYVTDTAKVYDTSAGVKTLDLDMPANDESNSLEDLRQKMGELNRRLDALNR